MLGLFQSSLKVSLGTVGGGIEADMVLPLIFLKRPTLLYGSFQQQWSLSKVAAKDAAPAVQSSENLLAAVIELADASKGLHLGLVRVLSFLGRMI